MFDDSLWNTVEQFAQIVKDVPDAELDRAWAWGAYDSEGVRFAFFRTYEELRELAVKMAAKRSANGPATSEAQRILAHYHAAYRDLQATMVGLQANEADQAPAKDEWSPKRVLAHIVGADAGFWVLTKYALERHRSQDGRPAEIPDEFWDACLGEEAVFRALLDGPLDGLRAYHQGLHQRVLEGFADITAAELEAPSMYWEGYPMSLRFRLHRFDSHLRQHTVQVDKTLAALGQPPNEARRLLRLIYVALAEAEGATIGAWNVGAKPAQEVAKNISTRAVEIAGILDQDG